MPVVPPDSISTPFPAWYDTADPGRVRSGSSERITQRVLSGGRSGLGRRDNYLKAKSSVVGNSSILPRPNNSKNRSLVLYLTSEEVSHRCSMIKSRRNN